MFSRAIIIFFSVFFVHSVLSHPGENFVRAAFYPMALKFAPYVVDFAKRSEAPARASSQRRISFAVKKPLADISNSPAFSLKGKVKI